MVYARLFQGSASPSARLRTAGRPASGLQLLFARAVKTVPFGSAVLVASTVAAVLLSLLWPAPASAQYFGRNKVQYDTFAFQILPTDHFDLYFYEETSTAARDAARMADRWYQRHATLFGHDLTARRPLIFYANDADFQQTNVIGGAIGQGVGGVTEGLKQRVVMPFTGFYGETDHVLGHELVHSFQYDLALSTDRGIDLRRLPLWLIEGMAEYLSLGSNDPHTAMWLRDALARDALPTIRDLSTGRFFPYRFGQAYMAYIGGTYGDGAVTGLYTAAGQAGVEAGIQVITGLSADSLSADWIDAVTASYGPLLEGRTPAREAGRTVLSGETGAGDINIGPALSPDGRYVAFLSSKDLFSMGLYVADAETGDIVSRLRSVNRDAHFDAIRFINSAGTWSPDGRRFAFVTFARGDNELAIWNVETGRVERRFAVGGVTALAQPAWSPDGAQIAVSGMDGGISDLYLVDIETGTVRQLTSGRFADLQPAWSPDGRTLAFVSDAGPEGTDFSTLRYGRPRLALLDVASGSVEPLRPVSGGMQHNPQFTPDGRGLYFISDHDGFKDVHHLTLSTGVVTPITHLQTGVSGYTSLSPAMTVAATNGRMMMSVFSSDRYSIVSLDAGELGQRIETGRAGRPASADAPDAEAPTAADSVQAGLSPVPDSIAADSIAGAAAVADTSDRMPLAGVLPPWTTPGAIDQALSAPTAGLPAPFDRPARPYSARLRLDGIAPPTLGVSAGGGFGTRLGGSIGLYFSDMLGDHELSVELLANGTPKDLGGQVAYLNRKHRFNYGAQVAHIPYLQQQAFQGIATDPATGFTTERVTVLEQRVFADQVGVIGTYPLQTTRRFEVQTGLTRYGFDYQQRDFYLYPGSVREARVSLAEPDPLYLSQSAAAYVVDYANFGFVSPVQGGRYRLQVGSTLGSVQYASVLADLRRYVRIGQVTLAGKAVHVGNYGADEQDVFASTYLGDSYATTYLRGYSFNSFEPEECFDASGSCGAVERLVGTRAVATSLEVRVPLFGTEQYGVFNFPYLPTEIAVFADAGLAWTEESAPVFKWARDTDERVPVLSVGASARMNVLGSIILEVFYAVPFQRPDKGGFIGVGILPGW